MLPSVLGTLEPNRRLRDEVRLFEIGKGYLPEHANERREPREVHEVALVLARKPVAPSFATDALRLLQGVIVDLFDALHFGEASWTQASRETAWADPVRRLEARFVPDAHEPAVVLAEVKPQIASALGLRGALQSDVVAATISIDQLLLAPRQERRYRPRRATPAPSSTSRWRRAPPRPRAIERCILDTAAPLHCTATLFDVYEGKSVGPDRKSLAYHLMLRADDRTLGETEVQEFLRRLEQRLREQGSELRSG